MERTVKMTTTVRGRIAGSKRQIGEALYVLVLEEKSNGSEKKYYVTRKAAHASQ